MTGQCQVVLRPWMHTAELPVLPFQVSNILLPFMNRKYNCMWHCMWHFYHLQNGRQSSSFEFVSFSLAVQKTIHTARQGKMV